MKRKIPIAAILWFFASVCLAQQPGPAPQIIRDAVQHEVTSATDPNNLYLYRLKRETNSGVLVRDMVEIRDGIVARTVTWNGRQLTPEERAKDDEKLEKILTSEEEQHKRFGEQRADEERVLRMLKALPDACLFTGGSVEMLNGRPTLRFNFVPNPHYEGSSRELIAFKEAEGTVWVDQKDRRIVRLDAHLVRDVNIGWGLLGHINKGGTVHLEQQLVPGNRWRITVLTIDATGNALFFKTINIKQRQWSTNFRPVRPMTLAAAVDLLKKQDVTK